MDPKVVACMTTYPPRYDMAFRTMQVFGKKQVDEFYLYVNDAGTKRSAPDWLRKGRAPSNAHVTLGSSASGNLGDVGKFYPLPYLPRDCYVLLLDDDLEYPPDYAERMTEEIDRYEGENVVGVHGCDLPQEDVSSYYREGQINKTHYAEKQSWNRAVHLLGTGTVGFRSSLVDITREDFPIQNMVDVFFAEYCQRQGIGMVMIRRESGWIQTHATPDEGIYERYKEDDAAQTFIINRTEWRHHVHIGAYS